MKTKERKSLQKNLARENIGYFFSLLEKGDSEYKKDYVLEIKKLSEAFNIRLSRDEKLKFCKKCLVPWNVKTREIRLIGGFKEYICRECGFSRRFKFKD